MEPPTPTMSEPMSPSPSHSAPDPEMRTRDLFTNAKVSLDALSAAFATLHGETLKMAATNTSNGSKDMTKFRQQINEQEQRHLQGIDDIQRIIDDLLENQVVGEMREEVEQEINSHIDKIVNDCVGECLKAHLPQDLQSEVEDSKKELERARLALYNSESRRMNSKLRSDKPDQVLDTLAMPDGTISPHFPKDLNALFSLDAETCKALATDYGLPDVADSDSRDKNLNKFMQFCGVRYQLVREKAVA